MLKIHQPEPQSRGPPWNVIVHVLQNDDRLLAKSDINYNIKQNGLS